ncbi:MAG: hypothetical protein L3J74_17150 [Bacteroidales bacterium]|nr:hypothetical protein [Bacteroidales bacterium]
MKIFYVTLQNNRQQCFGTFDADYLEIEKKLAKLGRLIILKNSKNINIYLLNDIKVDIVNYPYQWIDKPLVEQEIILAGKKDISAMKIGAITGRGTRKDFIDIYFLLKYFSLEEILQFFVQKYPSGSTFLALKSLSYFVDADKSEMPKMFSDISWEYVNETIKKTVSEYLSSI